jgi:hypothetical protein
MRNFQKCDLNVDTPKKFSIKGMTIDFLCIKELFPSSTTKLEFPYGQTQTFSECYETSDMNSSFGSERDRWREVKREEARAKFNDAQILCFEDMFSHLHQPKLEKKKKKNIVWKERVIYYNYLIN